MDLKNRILNDIKEAMKSKEAERLSAIRFLQSAVKNREIELRPNSIDDQEIMAVIKKLIKQRQDSIEQFEKAGRSDLADKEKFELKVMQDYLPAQLGKDQIEKIVAEVIQLVGAQSVKDMGKVMKAVQEKTAGSADNKLVADIIKSKLQ